jgi:AcrR family transcriptional regulator
MSRPTVAPITTVRERLDLALVEYLSTLTADDIGEINIESVAQAAGVSRATAYRHFGDREGLLFHAAILLTRRHADRAGRLMAQLPTVAGQIEEGFAYTAREIRKDRMLRLLLTSRRTAPIDSVIRSLTLEISSANMLRGQRDGQVRADLTVEELVDWLTEQEHVMIRLGLDEPAARTWARRFVLPVLRPQDDAGPAASEMTMVFGDIEQRIDALKTLVRTIHATTS